MYDFFIFVYKATMYAQNDGMQNLVYIQVEEFIHYLQTYVRVVMVYTDLNKLRKIQNPLVHQLTTQTHDHTHARTQTNKQTNKQTNEHSLKLFVLHEYIQYFHSLPLGRMSVKMELSEK